MTCRWICCYWALALVGPAFFDENGQNWWIIPNSSPPPFVAPPKAADVGNSAPPHSLQDLLVPTVVDASHKTQTESKSDKSSLSPGNPPLRWVISPLSPLWTHYYLPAVPYEMGEKLADFMIIGLHIQACLTSCYPLSLFLWYPHEIVKKCCFHWTDMEAWRLRNIFNWLKLWEVIRIKRKSHSNEKLCSEWVNGRS